MTKQFTKIITLMIIAVMLLSITAAAANVKLQIYFSPKILNDATGELEVEVNLKNFNTAVHKSYGDICGLTFMFEFDTEKFDIKKDDNGNPAHIMNDKTLIKASEDMESEIKDGRVVYTFLDQTLNDNLISQDGTLFKFTLVAKNPMAFWNSNDRYYLRFVPGSIAVVTYNNDKRDVHTFYNTEGVDIGYGPYNYSPSLIAPSVDKTLVFEEGKSSVKVNDLTVETDAAPYIKDGSLMIPVRYLSENIGMRVEWNGDKMVASSYAEYKTLIINEKTDKLYINAKQYVPKTSFETINGRIYISTDVVQELYPGAKISSGNGFVTIYIP